VNGDDGIPVVVLTGKNRLRLDSLDLLPKDLQFGPQFTLNRLAFAGQFEIGVRIGQALGKSVVFFDLLAQTLAGGQDFLGTFLVLPEIGLGYLFLESFKFFAALGGVKESSSARWRVASGRHILFAVRRSRWLLVSQRLYAVTGIRSHSARLATPSPGPLRLVKAPVRPTLSPKGERVRNISAPK
jgi:hypothetical protein